MQLILVISKIVQLAHVVSHKIKYSFKKKCHLVASLSNMELKRSAIRHSKPRAGDAVILVQSVTLKTIRYFTNI